jgi:predicted nucleotidyltransferase
MRVAGIVVEYNPMHNGHLYHLQQTKHVTGADAVVAIMSGNFLQRGEPALLDKWTRTEMALQNGVDLVLELPFVYANQSATQFAFGAIATLDALGIVDAVCFGSEHGELHTLLKIRDILLTRSDTLQQAFADANNKGVSFPKAMAEAVSQVFHEKEIQDVIRKPNNALGIAYLQALSRLQSKIQPFTIQRAHAGYHTPAAEHDSIASATAIRNLLFAQDDTSGTSEERLKKVASYIPLATQMKLADYLQSGKPLMTWERFAQPLFTKLETLTPQQLAHHLHMDEGLAYRIHHNAKHSRTVYEMIRKTKTRRYTWTRIQRALTAVLMSQTRDIMNQIHADEGPSYIRVLGFTPIGRSLLKRAKKTARLPIVTKIVEPIDRMLELDLLASRVYMRGYPPEFAQLNRDASETVLILSSASQAIG